ncbi:MAG: GlsB/YeaQ/YmgE family stress response membrane protein [Anaerolineae bacterium]
MGLLAWVVFGALAGWVASLIAGTNERQGCILNIVVGIVGAFLGGLIMQFLTGAQVDLRFNLPSFLVAVLGAVVLLALLNLIRRR